MRAWKLLCVRLRPFGLWVVGPQTRRVISAALDDAATYRNHEAIESPDGCPQCLNEDDIGVLALAGMTVSEVTLCPDHKLDADARYEYRALLDRMGVTDRELAKLRAKQFMADLQNGDAD